MAKRAYVVSSNDEVGIARKNIIQNAFDKIQEAEEKGFYLEAITILESLIADRLESLISLLGKKIGFQTLEASLRQIEEDLKDNFDTDFNNFIEKTVKNWKWQRNRALHQMAKLERNELHEWDERYSSFKGSIKDGVSIFRRIDKEIHNQRKHKK